MRTVYYVLLPSVYSMAFCISFSCKITVNNTGLYLLKGDLYSGLAMMVRLDPKPCVLSMAL